jgi:hypothetical protein
MKTTLPNNQPVRRGIALMLVMVAILVTGSMAVAYFGSRDNSIAISMNVEAAARARAVAESGLDLAVAILETDSDWRVQHVDGVILDSFAFGGGEITLIIIDTDTDSPPTESTNKVEITILSSVGGITQTTKATATIFPDEEEFDVDYSEFALFSQSHLTIRDVASVQQWTASPLGNQQNTVQIGTLATSPMSVQINSWGQNSNLELHTLSTASSMVSSSLTSNRSFSEHPPFPKSPDPPQNAAPLELPTNKHHSSHSSIWSQNFTTGITNTFGKNFNTFDVYEGAYEIDTLQLNSNQPVVIHGDVTLSIKNTLTLNSASIELAQDATLTVHVGGDVKITSSYIGNENHSINSWSDPSRVQLFGHNDTDWDLRGTTTIKGEIYAPESDIELTGLSTICGRIAAEEITLRGASRLLYDQTLDHGGFADDSSSLYDDDGTMLEGLRQLAQLDPVLISSLQQAAFAVIDDEYGSWQDWWSSPTQRPNEVIYTIVVYGVDARRWESLARQARRMPNQFQEEIALVFDR